MIEVDAPEAKDFFLDEEAGGRKRPEMSPRPLAPELAGPFAQVAAGEAEGVPWTVWRATATDGRLCQTFELGAGPEGGRSSGVLGPDWPVHHGIPATCVFDPESFAGDRTFIVVLSRGRTASNGSYVEGLASEDVTELVIEDTEGADVHVAVDPASHVWAAFPPRSVWTSIPCGPSMARRRTGCASRTMDPPPAPLACWAVTIGDGTTTSVR